MSAAADAEPRVIPAVPMPVICARCDGTVGSPLFRDGLYFHDDHCASLYAQYGRAAADR